MSALPFGSGSALPYGSAYPAPVYGGSALPPMYPTSYPSYDAGYQSYPTVSSPTYPPYVVPEAAPIPTPAVFTTSQREDASERRKRTKLEEQLEIVKELEKQLEATVHKLEMEHVKLNQQHSTEYNALFQQQKAALTDQTQKVINIFSEIPLDGTVTAPQPLFDPASPPNHGGSSAPNKGSASTPSGKTKHPLEGFQDLQKTIMELRRKYDKKVADAKAKKNRD